MSACSKPQQLLGKHNYVQNLAHSQMETNILAKLVWKQFVQSVFLGPFPILQTENVIWRSLAEGYKV